jgi:hypothetical protein
MAYKYKVSPVVQIFSILAVCLDIFLLPLIAMSAWNEVVVHLFNVRAVTYFQAMIFKFGYSAFRTDWFSSQIMQYRMEDRFDDYTSMISIGFLQVTDEIKKKYLGNV